MSGRRNVCIHTFRPTAKCPADAKIVEQSFSTKKQAGESRDPRGKRPTKLLDQGKYTPKFLFSRKNKGAGRVVASYLGVEQPSDNPIS